MERRFTNFSFHLQNNPLSSRQHSLSTWSARKWPCRRCSCSTARTTSAAAATSRACIRMASCCRFCSPARPPAEQPRAPRTRLAPQPPTQPPHQYATPAQLPVLCIDNVVLYCTCTNTRTRSARLLAPPEQSAAQGGGARRPGRLGSAGARAPG